MFPMTRASHHMHISRAIHAFGISAAHMKYLPVPTVADKKYAFQRTMQCVHIGNCQNCISLETIVVVHRHHTTRSAPSTDKDREEKCTVPDGRRIVLQEEEEEEELW
tara:strand:+ start:479 stop:799 length:321 start_codon:yes stop_codon:yes gene_type:complete